MHKPVFLIIFLSLIFSDTLYKHLYADDLQEESHKHIVISVVLNNMITIIPAKIPTNSTYFISTSGNDSADGLTPARAWATINKVNNELFSPGDSILFKRGDMWNEQLVISSSGEANRYITFGAYGAGDLPVINGRGLRLAKFQGMVEISGNKKYIIIENLRVINAGVGYPDEINGINFSFSSYGIIRNCKTYYTEAAGIKSHHSHDILIDSNEIELACLDSKSESLSISGGGSYNFEVKNNVVHNNADVGRHNGGTGIALKAGAHDGIVHHNEIYDIHWQVGIYPGSWNTHTYNIEIYNNYIHDFTAGGTGISTSNEQGGLLENIRVHHNIISNIETGMTIHAGRAGIVDLVKDIFIYNNTIYNCGLETPSFQGGFLIRNPDSTNVHVKNNIFSKNTGYQIGFSTIDGTIPRLGYHIDYNLLDGPVNTPTVAAVEGIPGANPIIQDPLFMSTRNFHLQTGSPAKNACDNSVWEATPNISDYDNIPITDNYGHIVAPGGIVSCGAYE